MKAKKKKRHIFIWILLAVFIGVYLTVDEYYDVKNARIARENALQDALAKDRAYSKERTAYAYGIIDQRNAAYEAEQKRLTDLKNDPEYRENAVQTETLPITAIGDSVMLGAADVMRSTFVRSSVDAQVSRSQYALLDIVIDAVSAGTLGNPVVIGIGTNGPLSPSVCEEVIDLCGNRDIFWLTTTNNWQFYNTETILALPETHSNVTIIDWDTISAGHSEYFYNDGIHLTPAGRSAYTEAIKDSLTSYYWDHLPEEPDHRIFMAGDDTLLSCVSKIPSSLDLYLYGDENLNTESLNAKIEELKAAGNLGTTQVLVISEERENAKELVDLCSSMEGFLHVVMIQKPGSKPLKSYPGADSVYSFILQEEDLMMDGIHMNAGTVRRLADFIMTQVKAD